MIPRSIVYILVGLLFLTTLVFLVTPTGNIVLKPVNTLKCDMGYKCLNDIARVYQFGNCNTVSLPDCRNGTVCSVGGCIPK